MEKYKILFVCLGNICRSPAAHGVMQRLIEDEGLDSVIEVDSAGTYGGHQGQLPDHRMRRHAARRGYDLTHRSRPVVQSDFTHFDMIVAMDDGNARDLKWMARTDITHRLVMMGDYLSPGQKHSYVPDPYYGGPEDFELALDLVEDACANLLDYIKKNKLI
ncbi:MAG: low molecular weight phosphotyrosine protein phosphatase [Bacteroidales bacterium]|uniref:low molecular weight protein-tyrosine-phosphatase n=1 Tax=Sodaliphilus sp. TaxID=2815818 RepID=UPI001B71ED8A|nr:low molecular weight phosphotyrosine protein phosphatase [Candidatus Sodaliphilus limicaballi]